MERLSFLLLDANVVIHLFASGIWERLVESCDIYLARTVRDEAPRCHSASLPTGAPVETSEWRFHRVTFSSNWARSYRGARSDWTTRSPSTTRRSTVLPWSRWASTARLTHDSCGNPERVAVRFRGLDRDAVSSDKKGTLAKIRLHELERAGVPAVRQRLAADHVSRRAGCRGAR
jgi:hypothetical protein